MSQKPGVDVWIDSDDPPPSLDEGPQRAISNFQAQERTVEKIDELAAQFRRSGLVLLTSGFVFQGLSVLIGS
jgi:hypothetical protein